MVFRHRVGETITEIELCRVATAFAIAGERVECSIRIMGADRHYPDDGHLEEFADVPLGFIDARTAAVGGE